MADQTQRGRRPEGQTRPSVVKGLRTSQDPAWSEPSGQDKTQCGQRPEGQTRPSVVRGPERSDRPSEVRALRRHEPVPQPEGQSASRPECLVTHPCPDCFSRPRASRSSLSFSCVLPPSLLSSFVFPCCFPRCCPEAGGAQ